MAGQEEEQGPLHNLQALGDALQDEGEQGGQPTPTLNVLSWNLYGGYSAGTARARNHVVPRVVQQLRPHVVLLQKVPSQKIINQVIALCRPQTQYAELDIPVKTEVRILYDANVFDDVERLDGPLDDIVEEIITDDEYELAEELLMYGNRVLALRLRHIATGRRIIFMSFRNKYRAVIKATRFCNIVARLANVNHENLPVIAGAGFQCTLNNIDTGNAHALGEPDQEDSLVYASPHNNVTVNENGAVNVFPNTLPADDHQFHQIFDGLTQEQLPLYRASLRHNPQTCNLTIT